MGRTVVPYLKTVFGWITEVPESAPVKQQFNANGVTARDVVTLPCVAGSSPLALSVSATSTSTSGLGGGLTSLASSSATVGWSSYPDEMSSSSRRSTAWT